jgi:intracellular septation protein
MAATLISVLITYYIYKKIPMMPLISAAVVGLFGGLTILTNDEFFIKIKPTLINLVFAAILLIGAIRGKGLLKNLMDGSIKMSDNAWLSFSVRWGIFFIFLALANEIVWRNFSTDIWVKFKVFGLLSATFVFMIAQMPFLKKHMIEDNNEKNS